MQCIATISTVLQIMYTILAHVQIITIGTIGGDCAMHILHILWLMLFSTYYAQIYASIVGTGLVQIVIWYQVEPHSDIRNT